MSVHIEAKKDEVADIVLLPGDPLRAKYIAENYLEGSQCYNNVRGMLGYTGVYKGVRISVQGTGMGQASAGIYINELISFYEAKTLIRVGSCGSILSEVKIRDIVIAMTACTDSNMNCLRFKGLTYAPSANAQLLFNSQEWARKNGVRAHFGSILSTDTFYHDDPNFWKMWAEYGVKAIEMETSQLYTLSAKYNVRALAILTVSDNLISREETTAQERETTFNDMMKMALEIVL